MPNTASEIAQLGKQLPRAEREKLVDELLASLNEPATSELDAAWEAEIERWLAAYDRGEVHSLAAEEVLARARRAAWCRCPPGLCAGIYSAGVHAGPIAGGDDSVGTHPG